MAKKRSKVRVVRPRSGKMWIEPLEKRELMAASDLLISPPDTPQKGREGGHALAVSQGEPFSGGVNTEPQAELDSKDKPGRDDDSVVVIIL